MTGQRKQPGYGRLLDGPLQLAVPRRLPGGVWGSPPLTGRFSFDGNGIPIDPANGLPSFFTVLIDVRNDLRALQSQTEWPIPTRWELQIGVLIEPDTELGTAIPWPGINAASFLGSIDTSIESASVAQPLQLGPGVWPLVAAQANTPGLTATFPVVAQQVRVSFFQVVLNQDRNLAIGQTTNWVWKISTMIGLTAPAIT